LEVRLNERITVNKTIEKMANLPKKHNGNGRFIVLEFKILFHNKKHLKCLENK